MFNDSYVFCMQSSMEHRRLSVDLAEVIIRWDLQRIKEEMELAAEGTEVRKVFIPTYK